MVRSTYFIHFFVTYQVAGCVELERAFLAIVFSTFGGIGQRPQRARGLTPSSTSPSPTPSPPRRPEHSGRAHRHRVRHHARLCGAWHNHRGTACPPPCLPELPHTSRAHRAPHTPSAGRGAIPPSRASGPITLHLTDRRPLPAPSTSNATDHALHASLLVPSPARVTIH